MPVVMAKILVGLSRLLRFRIVVSARLALGQCVCRNDHRALIEIKRHIALEVNRMQRYCPAWK